MGNPSQLTFTDLRMKCGRGGARPGAGRPAAARPVVHHVKRDEVSKSEPAHVTLRVVEGVPSLRRKRFLRAFQRSLRKVRGRVDFRVVAYSVQIDHVHMIVESAGRRALGCGMKSISSRLAFAVNRVFRRQGPVLDGRYHVHVLRTPREVRAALAYVLLNARKHWVERRGAAPPVRLDEASSGRWFDGWKSRWNEIARQAREGPQEVAAPHTWLLNVGWRHYGLVDLSEVPGG